MVRLLPPLLLGMLLTIYWGRVLRMAYKARRQTGRAANIVPAEHIGRVIRIIWFPVIVVWVGYPFVVGLSGSLPVSTRPLYFSTWIAWGAVVVSGVALYLSIRCWRAMGRHWRMGIDPREKNPLIDSGPFAYVRHPIYALSMILMLATMAMIPSPLLLAAGGGHIGLLLWESRREEAHQLAVQGDAYRDYRRRVGGLVPRINVAK